MELKRRGRPTFAEMANSPSKPTRRQMKDKELLSLLTKIKPHIADSVLAAAKIMRNDQANDENKLRAATILLQQYNDLVMSLYDGKEDIEDDTEKEENAVFSLKVVNNETESE